jgi:hypothetical protein
MMPKPKTQMSTPPTLKPRMPQHKMLKHKLKNQKRNLLKKLRKSSREFNKKSKKIYLSSPPMLKFPLKMPMLKM